MRSKKSMEKPETLAVRIDRELKNLIGLRADEEDLTLNEYVAQVFAKELGRPDLAAIPRKSFGRPRKAVPA